MIEFKSKKPRLSINFENPNEIEVTFITSKHQAPELESMKDGEIIVQVKKFVQKRTLTQNAYLWVLLDKIGEKVGKTKESVYKEYIRDYGVFQIIPIKAEAIDSFISKWQKNGLGWDCNIIDSKLDGYKNVIAYFGSSTYNTKEMARVIDAVLVDCEGLGISTMSREEILLLENPNKL